MNSINIGVYFKAQPICDIDDGEDVLSLGEHKRGKNFLSQVEISSRSPLGIILQKIIIIKVDLFEKVKKITHEILTD